MKHLSRLFFITLLAFGFSNVDAQDKNNPWQISIGVNAVDAFPSGDGGNFSETIFEGYFNVGDHWNVLPSLSTISVSKYLEDGFSFGVTGSLNRITKWGDIPGSVPVETNTVDDLSYYGIDGVIKYSVGELINSNTIEPFVGIGGGYTWIDEIGAGTLNGTLGLNIWLNDNIGFTLQSSYKHAFVDNLQTHFQHAAGISIKFGGTDTDGDGIYDKEDACPDVPGLEAFNGCPDTDGDGLEDSKDDCPNEAGLAELNGCPDTDGDGIADNADSCPTVAGLKALSGCPDADGDGVTDADDNCPNQAGPAANKGCPWTDKDNDGVLDKDDQCPEVKGTVANNGCPDVSEEIQRRLNEFAKSIQFENGKAGILFDSSRSSIKSQSATVLSEILSILKDYPSESFTVEGHADATGSEGYNQKLSETRANSVKDYLVENGIDASRLTAVGFGESKPIDTNSTIAGRTNNRRVEINLVK